MDIPIFPTIIVSVGELLANEYNPKKGLDDPVTKREYEYLKTSLAEGYVQEIIVRENEQGHYEIVDGFHRYLALKEMGVEKIPVKNLGAKTLEEAMKWTLRVEKNKVPVDAIMEAQLLKRLIANISPEELAKSLPYTAEQIANQVKLLDFDFDALKRNAEEAGDLERPYVFRVEIPKDLTDEIQDLWERIKSMEQFDEIPESAILLTLLTRFIH